MPLITTHNYFAKDVFKNTKKEIAKTFEEKQNIYELFAQGFDTFTFYLFFKPKQEDLQEYCHLNKTDTFFLNLIKKMKENNLQNNPTMLAILYGHICHYELDSTTHPYIAYKTGRYYKEKPETIKYKGLHNEMEMHIDAYLYEEREQKPFKNFKIHKHLITKEKIEPSLIQLLNEVYEETFRIRKGGNKYLKGCKIMYYSYKILIEDKTGIKKFFYCLVDKITPKKIRAYVNYSTYITNIKKNYLNLEHKTWTNPWNNQKSNKSFLELYEEAIQECTKVIEATHDFLHNKMTETEYKKVLKDKSYLTGLSWRLKNEMKYLEF